MTSRSGRERVLAALNFSGTDDVPVVLPYIESLYLRDRTEELTGCPWYIPRYGTVEEIVSMYRKCRENLGMDWTKVNMGDGLRPWERRATEHGQLCVVNKRTGAKSLLSEPSLPGGTVSCPDDLIRREDDIARLIPLTDAERLLASHPLRVAAEVVKDIKGDFFTYANIGIPFSNAKSFFGMTGLFEALQDAPNIVDKALERICEDDREKLQAIAHLGLDGVWIESTLSGADMISRDHYDRFVHPFNIRIAQAAKQLGLKTFFYFTGNPMDRLDRLADTGADCVAVEENKKGYNISLENVRRALKDQTAVMGNTDVMALEKGDFSAVAGELQHFKKIGRSGGILIGCGSPLTPDTPVQNVRQFIKMARASCPGRE